jgi:hypothetical protein
VIKRAGDYAAHPAAAAVVVPPCRELLNRRRSGRARVPRSSGKRYSAPRLATPFRLHVGFCIGVKPLRVLNVETAHKTVPGRAAFFAAATIVYVAAACAMRDLAIAATSVNLTRGSRGVFSRVPRLSAENTFPVSPVFAIPLQPELRRRLRRFAGRANLQFRNRQDSLILPLGTHEEVQFV